jgi:alkanesulfonate monooxygenase SsuD/methylene tetrahydromethanopterin reductase-like flavin-dependent oxidoreductase (luciferase family)
MIGGGGRKMLRLAAQYADIVNIIPRWRGGWGNDIRDQTIDEINRKISRVKKAAKDFGRDPDSIAFQLFLMWNEITDEPEQRIEDLMKNYGVTTDEIENSEFVHFGSSASLIDKVKRLREETGVSYFVFSIRSDQFEEYAESIVQPLTS